MKLFISWSSFPIPGWTTVNRSYQLGACVKGVLAWSLVGGYEQHESTALAINGVIRDETTWFLHSKFSVSEKIPPEGMITLITLLASHFEQY